MKTTYVRALAVALLAASSHGLARGDDSAAIPAPLPAATGKAKPEEPPASATPTAPKPSEPAKPALPPLSVGVPAKPSAPVTNAPPSAGAGAEEDSGDEHDAGGDAAEGGPSMVGFPCAGLVLGDAVQLRSGPGVAYEPLAKLARDDSVTLLLSFGEWYGVKAKEPPTVFLSSQFVEKRGEGVGVVTRNRVNVRAKDHLGATVVCQLQHGDFVKIREDRGAWLAIEAPSELVLYVHQDLVRRTKGAPEAAPAAAASESVTAAAPVSARELLIEARDAYLHELDKQNMEVMDFGTARRLYEEALSRAEGPATRMAAERGLKQVEAAEKLKADYMARLEALEQAKPE